MAKGPKPMSGHKATFSAAARREGNTWLPSPSSGQLRRINALADSRGLTPKELLKLKARLVTTTDAADAIAKLTALRPKLTKQELREKPPWLRKIIKQRKRQALT